MHTSNVIVAWARSVLETVDAERADLGVEARELTALTLIAEHEGFSVEWLRHRIGLTQSGTVRLVDRLAGRRLLERVPTPGRNVPLRLTPDGAQLLATWAERRDHAVDVLLAALARQQRDQLVTAIRTAVQGTPRDRGTADAMCGSCTWPACGTDCPVDLSVADELA